MFIGCGIAPKPVYKAWKNPCRIHVVEPFMIRNIATAILSLVDASQSYENEITSRVVTNLLRKARPQA